jgi:hypothetical protein
MKFRRSFSRVRSSVLAALLVVIAGRAQAVITITEIMYNPPGGGNGLEFIEIHNETTDPVDITGYFFSAGIDFTFTQRTFLDPGAYLVICADKEQVQSVYGITNVAGNWDPETALDNGGEAIELANPAGVVEARVRYNDRGKWPSGADGTGHSLEIRYVYSEMDDPDSWALSGALGGSPGKPNTASLADPVITINEALIVPSSGAQRWVEIYNAGTTPYDLSGHHITTDPGDLAGGTIPAGTTVGPRQWVTFTDSALGLDFAPRDETGRTFIALASPAGDKVLDARNFQTTGAGVSEARIPDGDAYFSDAAEPTRGGANSVTVVQDVVINEIMYHPVDDDVEKEWVELYNRGTTAVDLTGWSFTDGINFALPAGTSIAPDAYLIVCRNPQYVIDTYGLPAARVIGPATEEALEAFGILSDEGERLTLSDARGNIADTVRYRDGGEWPHWADGGGSSMELIDVFQENSNGQAWDSSDEAPKSVAKTYEYSGTFNAGEPEFHILLAGDGITLVDDLKMTTLTTTVSPLSTYVDFTDTWKFFKGTQEPAGGSPRWSALDFDDSTWESGAAIIGFGDGDETTVLADMQNMYISFYVRREFQVPDPAAITNLILEVEYDDGYVVYLNGVEVGSGNMRPGERAFDVRAMSSKEKVKETVDLTHSRSALVAGRNILGFQVHNASITSSDCRFQAKLLDGEFVVTETPNLFVDGTFETDGYRPYWTIQGTHYRSGRTAADAITGAGSLKVVATGDGDNKVNRIETSNAGFTAPALRAEQKVSFKARWIAGAPTLLTHGAYLGSTAPSYAASHKLDIPPNLGTPGAVNSVTLRQIAGAGSRNQGPVIQRVRHEPAVPAASVPVQVTARVLDPDGVAAVTLHYMADTPRPEGDAAHLTIPMTDPDGDGIYAAEVPGQPLKRRIVFYITAEDSKGQEGRFPLDHVNRTHPLLLDPTSAGPNDHLYAIYRHDSAPASGRRQSYRFWMHQANEAYLGSRPLHSNDMVDGSFIFQSTDVYYNAKARFSGSPWARQAWLESWRTRLPKDKPLHGSIESFNMEDHQDGGAVSAKERTSHYLLRYFNRPGIPVPYSLQWLVHWQVNDRVAEVREHVQTPNREFISRWFPEDDDGAFFEMDDRHTFTDSGSRQDSTDGRLLYPPYGPVTNGPDKEQYRYYFSLRLNEEADDFQPLIDLARLMSPSATPNAEFDEKIFDVVNVQSFCRKWNVSLNTDDWDQWGGNRGKNCYLYQGKTMPWVLILWDAELTYGNVGAFMPPPLTATSNYANTFAEAGRFLNRPAIKRVYYGAMKEMVDHQFQSSFLAPFMQKLAAVGASNTQIGMPNGFIDQRRTRLLGVLAGVTSPAVDFVVTTNGGAPLTTQNPLVTIEGKAPVEISEIGLRVNGKEPATPFELQFSSTDHLGWRVTGELSVGDNTLDFAGMDSLGRIIDATQFVVTVSSSGPPVIASIEPATAVIGETVVISGTNFQPGLQVVFGAFEATAERIDATRIDAVVPAGLAPGAVSVRVVNGDGTPSAPFPITIVAAKNRFIRGDSDRSLIVNLTDAIFTLNSLFSGGDEPPCLDAADADDNGFVNLTDAVVVLNHLFQGGTAPPAPYPDLGTDPTADDVSCLFGSE